VFNSPDGGFPLGRSLLNFTWMSTDGQHIKWRSNTAENFIRLSRVHERYRQTTDGRAIVYSEREREFMFAKNEMSIFDI